MHGGGAGDGCGSHAARGSEGGGGSAAAAEAERLLQELGVDVDGGEGKADAGAGKGKGKGRRKAGGSGDAAGAGGTETATAAASHGECGSSLSVLVLGLGGGALPAFLAHQFPQLQVTVVEVDPAVVSVARRCFGAEESGSGRVRVVTADAFSVVERLADAVAAGAEESGAEPAPPLWPRQAVDVVMVDMDSKDLREGLSFPPSRLVSLEFIAKLRGCLRPGGVLVVNMACRASEMQARVVAAFRAAFASVLLLDVPDCVNQVIVACESDAVARLSEAFGRKAGKAGKKGKAGKGSSSSSSRGGGSGAQGLPAASVLARALEARCAGAWESPLSVEECMQVLFVAQ